MNYYYLRGPVHQELSIPLPPVSGGEERAVSLEVLLVHGHADADAHRAEHHAAGAHQLGHQQATIGGSARHAAAAAYETRL